MRKCVCGCQNFVVQYRQVTTYDVTLDINTWDWICESGDEDVEEVDMCDDTTYICDECGKEYKRLEDIPEV